MRGIQFIFFNNNRGYCRVFLFNSCSFYLRMSFFHLLLFHSTILPDDHFIIPLFIICPMLLQFVLVSFKKCIGVFNKLHDHLALNVISLVNTFDFHTMQIGTNFLGLGSPWRFWGGGRAPVILSLDPPLAPITVV